MHRPLNRLRFRITGTALMSAALMLLILPLNWLSAALAAGIWHELCHFTAVKICGGNINRIDITASGAIMAAEPMTAGRELVCSLAGPAGSLFLLLLADLFPRIAVCGLVHGVYNLIPVYPLDGGRALHIGLFSLLPADRALHFSRILGYAVKFAALFLAVGCFLYLDTGIMPLLLAATMLLKTKSEKSLANCFIRGYNSPTIAKR